MSPTPLKIQLLTVAIAAIAATACSTACHEELLVAEAMRQAGDNAGELQAVLDRYDDGRRELAEYAVAATWGRVARTGAIGIIHPQDMIQKQFLLANQGSQPITIQEIVPSCDCVTASASTDTIAPGNSTTVTVSLVADTIAGSFRRHVNIFYNEKENPERLTLNGYLIDNHNHSPKNQQQ